MDRLSFGDNLQVLRGHTPGFPVDMIHEDAMPDHVALAGS